MATGDGDICCYVCKTTKEAEAFHYAPKQKDKRRGICKTCSQKRKNTPEYRKLQREYAAARANDPNVRARANKRYKDSYATVRGRAVAMWLSAKRRSVQCNLEFTICIGRIELALFLGRCERTGIMFDLGPVPKGFKFNYYAPSLDKRDPFGGCTYENVQVVCNAYNFGKGQMTEKEYISFCRKVACANVE